MFVLCWCLLLAYRFHSLIALHTFNFERCWKLMKINWFCFDHTSNTRHTKQRNEILFLFFCNLKMMLKLKIGMEIMLILDIARTCIWWRHTKFSRISRRCFCFFSNLTTLLDHDFHSIVECRRKKSVYLTANRREENCLDSRFIFSRSKHRVVVRKEICRFLYAKKINNNCQLRLLCCRSIILSICL